MSSYNIFPIAAVLFIVTKCMQLPVKDRLCRIRSSLREHHERPHVRRLDVQRIDL